jgi:hypothetical protein
MYRKDIIIMRREEVRRLQYVQKVMNGEVTQVVVAEALGVSDRQLRRIVKRVRIEGEGGVVHRLRGKASNRKFGEGFKERVLRIYRRKYEGFGPLLASEKLEELEEIKLSDETLRKWLIEADLWQKKRGSRKHRQWRERKARVGEMVQMDGSHHDWFEGRGSRCVLMGYIDDATGRVYARFGEYEGTIPVMESFGRYIKKYGIPVSVYLDRHSTYKQTKRKLTIEEELAGKELLSEFERACQELGVKVIHAHSPQAKGRIERLFRTFQDRVIKEMRLRGIKTIEEANAFLEEYLPIYNERFNVIAREKGDMHRKVPQGMRIERILCIKTRHALRNDFTVAHNKKLYQIFDDIKAEKVTVEERLDGTLKIYHNDQKLRYKEIEYRPYRPLKHKDRQFKHAGKGWKPPADHPWRRFKIGAVAQTSTTP